MLEDTRINPPSYYERDDGDEDEDRDYEGEREDAAYDAMMDAIATGGDPTHDR